MSGEAPQLTSWLAATTVQPGISVLPLNRRSVFAPPPWVAGKTPASKLSFWKAAAWAPVAAKPIAATAAAARMACLKGIEFQPHGFLFAETLEGRARRPLLPR